VLIAVTLSGVHVARYHELSPFDELRHVDYAMRVTHLDFVHLGDRLGQEAMREQACRGVDAPGVRIPSCHAHTFAPRTFGDDGYQTAYPHPPIYYLLVGFAARGLVGLGLFHSFVDPARLMSGALLGLGLALTYLSGRMLGLRALPLLAALTLVPTFDVVLHASSTVNPDASGILAGSLALLAVVAWEQGRLSMPVLAVLGFVATWLNPVNFLGVAIAAAWLSTRSPGFDTALEWVGRRIQIPDGGRNLASSARAACRVPNPTNSESSTRAAAVLVGGGIGGAVAWGVIYRLRATIDANLIPQNRQLAVHGVPRALFAPRNLFGWFPPVRFYDVSYLSNAAVEDARQLATFLFAGALIFAALRLTRRDSVAILGGITALAALVAAPLYMVVGSVVFHVTTNPLARYGLSLLPAMALVVAWSATGRFGPRLLAAFAGVTYMTVLLTIVVADAPRSLLH
jgi:hypothetical protein